MRVVASWSGGKDSCLAVYEAFSQGFEVSKLLSFNLEDANNHRPRMGWDLLGSVYKSIGRGGPRVISNLLGFINTDVSKMIPHEISPEIIAMQAQGMGIPLVQRVASYDKFEYEQQFKSEVRALKSSGIEGAVFGILSPRYPLDSSERLREYRSLRRHKDWVLRVCRDLGIKPIIPLWGRNSDQALADFVEKGFKAIIVVVNPNLLGEEWLGRELDHEFLSEVSGLNHESGIHAGASSFHTMVIDGPLFKNRLSVIESRKVYKNGYYVLEIPRIELVKKAGM